MVVSACYWQEPKSIKYGSHNKIAVIKMGEEKREYNLAILILLVLLCWPAAIVYYFTRPKVTAKPTRICSGCGRQIPAEYSVCPYCGRSMVGPTFGATPTATAPIAQPSGTKFCPNCGARVNPAARFCPSCGRQLSM